MDLTQEPGLVLYLGTLVALAWWHTRLHAAHRHVAEQTERAGRLDVQRLELLEEREHYMLRLRALELTNRITPSFAWLTMREVEILVSRGLLNVDNLGFSVMATRAIHHELHSERARQLNERLDASRLGELGRDAEAWPVYVGESVQRDSQLLDDLRRGGEAAAKIAAKIEQVVWRRAR